MDARQELIERINSMTPQEQQSLLDFANAVFPSRESQKHVLPANEKPIGIFDFLESLPVGPRSATTLEEIEASLQEGRKSWGS